VGKKREDEGREGQKRGSKKGNDDMRGNRMGGMKREMKASRGEKNEGKGRRGQGMKERSKQRGGKRYCHYLLVLQNKYSGVIGRTVLFHDQSVQSFDCRPSLVYT